MMALWFRFRRIWHYPPTPQGGDSPWGLPRLPPGYKKGVISETTELVLKMNGFFLSLAIFIKKMSSTKSPGSVNN